MEVVLLERVAKLGQMGEVVNVKQGYARNFLLPQGTALRNVHATQDPVPTARLGFTREDLDAALAHYGQVLDVSRDDLQSLLQQSQRRTPSSIRSTLALEPTWRIHRLRL